MDRRLLDKYIEKLLTEYNNAIHEAEDLLTGDVGAADFDAYRYMLGQLHAARDGKELAQVAYKKLMKEIGEDNDKDS